MTQILANFLNQPSSPVEDIAYETYAPITTPVDAPNEEIDFEQIEREMSRMMIFIMRDRSKHFSELSDCACKTWISQVKDNAGQYRKWNVWAFPAAKITLDVVQIALIGTSGFQPKKIDGFLKIAGAMQSSVDAVKQIFDSFDAATRTEGQAKSELSKLLFERNEREQQSFEQQTAEYFRKTEDARRRREDMEQAMARA